MNSNQIPMKVGDTPEQSRTTVIYTASITVLLAFLYAAQSIAVTYSKDDPHSKEFSYDPNSAVMATESLKLCLAFGLFYRQLQAARSGRGEVPAHEFDPKVVIRFAVPALIYMAGNNILFIALKYLDAPTYQVLGNIKIIVVAVIQRLALKSKKSVVQWLGVALLMLGMMVRRENVACSHSPWSFLPCNQTLPGAASSSQSTADRLQVIGASKLSNSAGDQSKQDTLLLGLFWMVCIACVLP